ncbi:MAG: PadR family transcriptional regulator [Paenibacillaceae bacterium]
MKVEPIYGSWMLEELAHHGYTLSAGTLYPLLRTMVVSGLLVKEEKNVEGKIRKYYRATEKGKEVLVEARRKAYELFKEIQSES